ncbi:hypothetical protein GCM10028790_27270 [Micromonospora taraxaci]
MVDRAPGSSTPIPAVVISASVVRGAISEIAPTVVVLPTPKPPATRILTGIGGAAGLPTGGVGSAPDEGWYGGGGALGGGPARPTIGPVPGDMPYRAAALFAEAPPSGATGHSGDRTESINHSQDEIGIEGVVGVGDVHVQVPGRP